MLAAMTDRSRAVNAPDAKQDNVELVAANKRRNVSRVNGYHCTAHCIAALILSGLPI